MYEFVQFQPLIPHLKWKQNNMQGRRNDLTEQQQQHRLTNDCGAIILTDIARLPVSSHIDRMYRSIEA